MTIVQCTMHLYMHGSTWHADRAAYSDYSLMGVGFIGLNIYDLCHIEISLWTRSHHNVQEAVFITGKVPQEDPETDPVFT